MSPKVSVIILNYHRPDDTIECINSVLASEMKGFSLEVVMVDNSEDRVSYEILRNRYPGLCLIKTPTNLGYAGGNNVGIRHAMESGADYVFILNNDCILEKDTLLKLFESAIRFPDAAIVAPLVCYDDNRSKIDSCGTEMDWLRLHPQEVRYADRNDPSMPDIIDAKIIPGSSLFMRTKILLELGLFNPDFFLIHEDADLCLRSREHGYKNLVITGAIVYHKLSKTLSAYPSLSVYYTIRNFLLLSRMHNDRKGQCVVYGGLLLHLLKKTVLWSWSPAGRQRFRWFLLGIRDYFLNKKGKCPY
ncbi:MAG: glycosyltransferase family 2 protein [Candidatus Omnitrophota bacterium]